MRTITSKQSAIYSASSRARSEYLRVEIKDSSGVWRDLSVYPGYDAVLEASWRESIDDPHMTADIVLLAEQDDKSLAPLMKSSPVNRGFDPANSWLPILKPNREVKISVALVAEGETPSAGDWELVFHGRVDRIEHSRNTITLQCRDLAGRLATRWIKDEFVYAYASVGGVSVRVRVWTPNTPLTLNEYVIPTDSKRKDRPYFYKVTTAGTTHATTEPTWPLSGTVADNDVVFTFQGALDTTGRPIEQVIQNILDDNLGVGSVTLYTPVSPNTMVTQFVVQRGLLYETLRNLVLLTIGWDLRYRWDSSTGTFRLTLYQPDRSVTSPVRTFTADEYKEVESFTQDIADVRNWWRVWFSDASSLHPDGTAKRTYVEAKDTTSIAEYDEQFAEIVEDSLSLIDSVSEATTLVNAALSDTKEPNVIAMFVFVHSFIHAQLNDYVRFAPNGRHHSDNLDVAITQIEHVASRGSIQTKIGVRGKPSAGARRWVENSGTRRPLDVHRGSTILEAPSGLTLSTKSVVGGQSFKIERNPHLYALGEEFEWHIGGSPTFTPDSSTYRGVTKSTEFVVSDLIPGKTQYARVIPRIRNASRLVRGMPTDALAFVPGYVEPAYLNSETVVGPIPPNGSFEGWLSPADQSPPDHWNMVVGAWARDVGQVSNDQHDGRYSLAFAATAVAAKIRSDFFLVNSNVRYLLEVWIKKVGSPESPKAAIVEVEWYTSAKSLIATDTLAVVLANLGTGWERASASLVAPNTAVFACVAISKSEATTYSFYVDAVSLIEKRADASEFINAAPPFRTTTSNVYATLESVNYTPSRPNEKVLVLFYGSSYVGINGNTEIQWRVECTPNSGGTTLSYDYSQFFNEPGSHRQFAFAQIFTLNAKVEQKTFNLQWRRSEGTGTCAQDQNDTTGILILPLPLT